MYELACHAISHIGNRRRKQEDNFYLGESQYMNEQMQKSFSLQDAPVVSMKQVSPLLEGKIVAISDGMGGHKGGEIASRAVVEHLPALEKSLRYKSEYEDSEDVINQLIFLINDYLLGLAQTDHTLYDMGATLSALYFLDEKAFIINLGDSRIYLLREDKLTRLTSDHTEEQMLEKLGVKDVIPYGKGRLTKYLGYSHEKGLLTADITSLPEVRAGDRFILSTDGLTDEVSDEYIGQIVRNYANSDKALSELVNSALYGKYCDGGRDNITVVIVDVKETNTIST